MSNSSGPVGASLWDGSGPKTPCPPVLPPISSPMLDLMPAALVLVSLPPTPGLRLHMVPISTNLVFVLHAAPADATLRKYCNTSTMWTIQ